MLKDYESQKKAGCEGIEFWEEKCKELERNSAKEKVTIDQSVKF